MLHGTIEMNGVAIGKWEATRSTPVMNDNYWYDCKVWYRNNEGHPMQAEFELVHLESLGALSLAAQVLQMGFKKAKPRPLGTDTEFPV